MQSKGSLFGFQQSFPNQLNTGKSVKFYSKKVEYAISSEKFIVYRNFKELRKNFGKNGFFGEFATENFILSLQRHLTSKIITKKFVKKSKRKVLLI